MSLLLSDVLELGIRSESGSRRIWDSIADVPDAVALTDGREELDRRLEAYYRDPTVGRPWPEVKAKA